MSSLLSKGHHAFTPSAGENRHIPDKNHRIQDYFYPEKHNTPCPKMCTLMDAGRTILLIHPGLIYTLGHPPRNMISPDTMFSSKASRAESSSSVTFPATLHQFLCHATAQAPEVTQNTK